MSELFQFLFSENTNIFLQSFGNPFIDFLFLAITSVLSEPGFILLASIIFWCFGKKTGIRLMYITLFSAFAAIFTKSLFGLPRPPEYLHKIQENGSGFPSGHALVSSGFLGYLGGKNKSLWIIVPGAAAILAVSLSRIYLGVHYAGDVVGGSLFGLALALVLLKKESSMAEKFNGLGKKAKYFVALMLPVILISTALFQSGLLKEGIESGLVMAGAGTGYLLEEEHIRLKDAKNNNQRIKRMLAGILILAIVYLIPGMEFSYFKYAMLGLTSTFIAPWVFTRIER